MRIYVYGLFLSFLFLNALAGAETNSDALQLKRDRAASPHDSSESSLRAGFQNLEYLKDGMAVVAYAPKHTRVIDKKRSALPKNDPLYFDDGFEADDTVLLKTRLGPEQPAVYVLFSEGPSADPEFFFILADNVRAGRTDKLWAHVWGTALAIPGYDAVYAAGRYNTTFTQRRKYVVNGNGLKEVAQPYYYVGLKTHTRAPITLFASPEARHEVAHLPKGSRVEVLLTDGELDDKRRACYLLKTPFGLTGWIWIPVSQYQSRVIEGISFWGD